MENVEFIIKGNTIYALKDGKYGEATCHPDDEFDERFGKRLAVARLNDDKIGAQELIDMKYSNKPFQINENSLGGLLNCFGSNKYFIDRLDIDTDFFLGGDNTNACVVVFKKGELFSTEINFRVTKDSVMELINILNNGYGFNFEYHNSNSIDWRIVWR